MTGSESTSDKPALGELLLTDAVEEAAPAMAHAVAAALIEGTARPEPASSGPVGRETVDRETVMREEARAWLERNGAAILKEEAGPVLRPPGHGR